MEFPAFYFLNKNIKKKKAKMQSVFLWVSRQYYLLFKITWLLPMQIKLGFLTGNQIQTLF